MKKYKVLTLVLLAFILPSIGHAGPWLTGPLLAPNGQTIPKGHINFETYGFFTDSYGLYNSHGRVIKIPDTYTLNITPLVSIGLSDSFDIQFSLPYYFNEKKSQSANAPADVAAIVGYQVYRQKEGHWLPSLKLSIQETFPTGLYRNLRASKLGTDATGAGSYQTTIGLNFQQLMQLKSGRYLRSRLSLTSTYPKKVNVVNFNAYGGGIGTRGNLSPGHQYAADLAFEYQLTQNWVPAFDILYLKRRASSFKGTIGTTLAGRPATIGHGEVSQLSIAPAIEYNFSERFGIITGVWLTVKGRESNDFWSAVVAVNYFM